jgi:hypothetical protein
VTDNFFRPVAVAGPVFRQHDVLLNESQSQKP